MLAIAVAGCSTLGQPQTPTTRNVSSERLVGALVYSRRAVARSGNPYREGNPRHRSWLRRLSIRVNLRFRATRLLISPLASSAKLPHVEDHHPGGWEARHFVACWLRQEHEAASGRIDSRSAAGKRCGRFSGVLVSPT